jgi:hypothetical protein
LSLNRFYAIIALGLLFVPVHAFVPLAPTENFYPVTIVVIDTQGLNIDGASVEIVNLNTSAIVDQGRTINGTFRSIPLASNDTFNAIVSTQAQTKQQDFQVTNGSNVVQFTLLRTLPLAQLSLTGADLIPNPTWTNVTGEFTATNTGQSNLTSSSIKFNSTSPLTVLGSGSLFTLGAVTVNSNRTLTVTFAIQPLANEGVYSIPYVLYYTDAYGRNFTATGSFGFNLQRTSVIGSSQLAIPSISYVLQQNGAGYNVAAQFVLANTGQTAITSASIKFNATYPLTVVGSGSLFSIGSIAVNSNRTLTVNFAVQPQANQGVYSIPYVLYFTDAYGRNFTSTGNFGFNLNRIVGSSQLLISSLTYSLQRTENAYMLVAQLVISNTGESNVTSASISFNSTSPLTVLGSGSLFSIGAIPVNSNRTLTVNFAVAPKANEGLFSVPYTLNYVSGGGSASETGALSFLVNGTPQVEIASVTLSSTKLTPGQSSVLEVNLLNVGDEQAFDVQVKLVGMTPVLSSNSSYVGLLPSGSEANATFGLNLPSGIPSGAHSLTLLVTYQDATGKVYNVTEPYSFNVFAEGTPDVKVQNILTDPVVLTAGTSGLMTVYLINAGTQQADNIVAQVSGAQDILASQSFSVGEINPNATVTTILGLNVNQGIGTGSHLLRIDLTYSNPLGQNFNQSSFIEVTIYPLQSFLTPLNEVILGGTAAGIIAIIIVARRLNIKI